MDNVRKEFEEAALLGCKAVREFLKYEGDNKKFVLKAKFGAIAMGTYSRVRATIATEEQLRQSAIRIDAKAATWTAQIGPGTFTALGPGVGPNE